VLGSIGISSAVNSLLEDRSHTSYHLKLLMKT
jgi:hypothetical protein